MKKAKRSKWISPDFDDALDDESFNEVAEKVERGNRQITRTASSPEGFKSFCKSSRSSEKGMSLDESLFQSKKRTRPDQDLVLWSQKHSPKSVGDLAVHPKKIEEVEHWLKKSLGKVWSRVLLMIGPAGCGKTATIQVLSKKLGFEVQEWTNPEIEGQNFDHFLSRAHRYKSLFGSGSKKLVLIEEIPPFCLRDPKILHGAIKRFKKAEFPLIIIYSESKRNDQQFRQLFPQEILMEVNQITFNPINATNLVKSLSAISMIESSRGVRSFKIPDKPSLTSLATSVNGDIRAAINALQFACLNNESNCDYKSDFCGISTLVSSKKVAAVRPAKVAAVGGKDPSIDLFHAIGKVLYAKRTPERAENHGLPVRLKAEKRTRLSFDPDELLETVPMSLESFNIFLHQSYSDFFTDVHRLSEAAECLSQADAFFKEWTSTGKMCLSEYGGQVGVRGLCHHNTAPQKTGSLKTFGKPEWFTAIAKYRTNLSLVTRPFLERGLSNVEIVTCLAPLVAKNFSMEIQPNGYAEAALFFPCSERKVKIAREGFVNDVPDDDGENVDFLIEEF